MITEWRLNLIAVCLFGGDGSRLSDTSPVTVSLSAFNEMIITGVDITNNLELFRSTARRRG